MTTTEQAIPSLVGPVSLERDRAVLWGGRCRDCQVVTFPALGGCPRCAGEAIEAVELPATGTVWSWTVQRFAPKAPYRGPQGSDHRPYVVGYVDLGEVIVEGRLAWPDGETPTIGDPAALTLVPVWTEDDGTEVLTYGFAPAGGA